MTQEYTKEQPKDGDTVLLCDHPDRDDMTFHFFKIYGGTKFQRPDGTEGEGEWIILCDDCYKKHFNNPQAAITGDAIWEDDTPIIKRRVQ
jgi:hypothetical protein